MESRSPSPAGRGFPDPVVSASIFCDKLQDMAICRLLEPLARKIRSEDGGYLWFIRYPKCGYHLKIRVHGPDARREDFRRELAEATDRFFASMDGRGAQNERTPGADVPAIDPEDQAAEDYPDRTLLWTDYRRSHVTLGGEPFLDDDDYCALFTRCLARTGERVLTALKPDERGMFSHYARQQTLLGLLIDGLADLGWDERQRVAYLAFHRDWLVRFAVRGSEAGAEQAGAQVVDAFDRRVDSMGAAFDTLRRTAVQRWNGGRPEAHGGGEAETVWADFLARVTDLCRDPDYHIDPFAADPAYAPIFKVFHGLGNQLGLAPMNEALSHHLLLRSSPAPRPEFQARPPEPRD